MSKQTTNGVPLLPCPFCSGKVRAPKCRPAGHACFNWEIACGCGASYSSEDEQGTIRGWNLQRALLDTAQPQGETLRNQCDGCQAGIPVVNGAHRMGKQGGYPDTMSCTAKLYAEQPAPVAPESINHGACVDLRVLLNKYIEHVGQCEGVDFISEIGGGYSKVPFDAAEIAELEFLQVYPLKSKDPVAPIPLNYGALDPVERLAVCRGEVAPVAVPRLEMSRVVRAHMEIPGCPVLTSNQCHTLAMKLNACLDELKRLNGIER